MVMNPAQINHIFHNFLKDKCDDFLVQMSMLHLAEVN